MRARIWAAALFTAIMAMACAPEEPQPTGNGADGPQPTFRLRPRPRVASGAELPRAVVLIVIDTLRADHLGCYGSTRGLTPTIDAFAARSITFRQAVAPSSWTRSSVASLLTSRYPTALACLDREDVLQEEELTLAELLRSRGFHTLAVSANGNAGRAFGFTQGFDVFYDEPPWDARRRYEDDPEAARKITGDIVTAAALHLVETRDEAARRRPLFLFAHYVDPHDPYFPHDGLLDEPVPAGRFSGSRTDLDRMKRMRAEHTEVDRERIRHLYRREVRYGDQRLGDLFLGLHQAFGSLDDLLVIVTADHGEGLWDHGERAHGCDLYEEQTHVPLLVHLPGMTEADARVVERPVSLVDVAPTILDVCGFPRPEEFQGVPLRMLWEQGTRGADHEYLYSEMSIDGRDFEALRSERYKVVRDRSRPLGSADAYQLFDLLDDPRERIDLARSQDPDVLTLLARYQEYLWRWSSRIAASGAVEGGSGATIDLEALDPSTRAALYGLGYIGAKEYREGRGGEQPKAPR